MAIPDGACCQFAPTTLTMPRHTRRGVGKPQLPLSRKWISPVTRSYTSRSATNPLARRRVYRTEWTLEIWNHIYSGIASRHVIHVLALDVEYACRYSIGATMHVPQPSDSALTAVPGLPIQVPEYPTMIITLT